MTDKDYNDFVKLISGVYDYYRQQLTDFTVTTWWEACKPLELEVLKAAMRAHAMDPERGHMLPFVSNIVRKVQGTPIDRAQLAWNKVHAAMSWPGATSDVVFDEAAIHAAINDLGGWPKLCRMEVEELRHEMHRFFEAYRVYVQRAGSFEYPRVLSGDRGENGRDDDYQRFGLRAPAPVLIGDKTACLALQGIEQQPLQLEGPAP